MPVLGLCIGEFCAAALSIDNKLVGASYEERFHRRKCLSGFPYRAVDYLLKHHGVAPRDIRLVAVMNETGGALLEALVQRMHSFSVDDYVREARDYWYPRLYEGKQVNYLDVFRDRIDEEIFPKSIAHRLLTEGETPANNQEIRVELIQAALGRNDVPINFVEHHLSHAIYGQIFAPSDAGRTLIFTADSYGDYSNSNVYRVAEGRIQSLFSSGTHNLGRLYRNITLLLGMKPYQHEYKVMGLAPYASEAHARKVRDIFARFMNGFDGDWRFREKPRDHYFQFQKLLEGVRFDNVAGGLQMYFEEMLECWFRWFLERAPGGVESILFSGGLSMNVKANMRLDRIAGEHGLTFYPAPSGDDYSHAVSAIFAAEISKDGTLPTHVEAGRLDRLDLGYEFTIADRTEMVAWARRHGYGVHPLDADGVARKLKAGKILALCHGRSEFGARALGFRSIIADPTNFDTIRRINLAIKQRDFWMPFAPAILTGHEARYLEIRDRASHRFMASSAPATSEGRRALSAAIHPYDHTARPQIVTHEANPLFAGIIDAFGRETGTFALLNTSLNLHGYPIVNNAEDLIFTMERSDLDGIVLSDVLILKQ